jgi:hypothetical protein
MATKSGLTYLSGLLRAGAKPVGAGGRAALRRVAAPPRANTSPHASPSASRAPADHADEVSRPLERDATERAAHTSESATIREEAAESTAPVAPGTSPVRGIVARHEQPARVFHAPPREDSRRRGLSDPSKAVESDAARKDESARDPDGPTPHTLEAHVNQLRARMQTRGAAAEAAKGEGEAVKTSRAAIVSQRAAVGAAQTQSAPAAKQTRPVAHAPASRARESQEVNAARTALPTRGEVDAGGARAPKLTINRLDVQVVNRADPQPPAPYTPPASVPSSRPDPWGSPDRSFLGRFF